MDTYMERAQERRSAIATFVIALVATAVLVGAVVLVVASGFPGFEGWIDTDYIARYRPR
jgi:hypothetical protein